MPRRPFPVLALSLGLAVALLAIIRPAFAQPKPDPVPADDAAHFPKVKVEPAAGGTVEGRLKLSAITLKTDIGSTTVAMPHVRRITFRKDPEGRSHDTVQLADKTVLRGEVTAEQFVVEISGGEARLKKDDVRDSRTERHTDVVGRAAVGAADADGNGIILGVDNIIFLAIIAGSCRSSAPACRSGPGAGHAHPSLFSPRFC